MTFFSSLFHLLRAQFSDAIQNISSTFSIWGKNPRLDGYCCFVLTILVMKLDAGRPVRSVFWERLLPQLDLHIGSSQSKKISTVFDYLSSIVLFSTSLWWRMQLAPLPGVSGAAVSLLSTGQQMKNVCVPMTLQTSQAMNLEQDIGQRGAVWKVITSKAVVGIFASQKLLLMISKAPPGCNQGLLPYGQCIVALS